MELFTIRSMAILKHGSIRKFAEAMGWSYRKAAYIATGRQQATASDIQKMADDFEIELPEQFRKIFFRQVTTNSGH